MRGRLAALVFTMGCTLPLLVTACGNSGPPDFVLGLATNQPAAATVAQGGTTTISFQVSALKGSSGSITLTVSGLPPTGVGIAPGVATVGIGSAQQFNLTAAANAAITSAPITLTATGVSGNVLQANSITHTQTLTLSVVAHP